jgi:wyosine [tRNA(Phe)-imidazoG37] synthetase (radical SAM superfamily)
LCLQNTPTLPFCNLGCVFCWRDIELGTLGSCFPQDIAMDPPDKLAEEMIKQSKNLIKHHIGLDKSLDNLNVMRKILKFWVEWYQQKGTFPKFHQYELGKLIGESNKKTIKALILLKACNILESDENYYWISKSIMNELKTEADALRIIDRDVTNEEDLKRAFKEAEHPKHAAISLAGEPTLYPELGGLVKEFRKLGMTTFIVTNGTHPEVIKKMKEDGALPTQLYVTLAAPNPEIYQKVCRPASDKEWKNLKETLQLLQNLPCRTVIRITCVKNLNMNLEYVKEYGQLIAESQPDFLDLKGFTAEGNALKINERIKETLEMNDYAPEYEELLQFAREFEKCFGFEILEQVEVSRDILLRVAWPKGKSIVISSIEPKK